MSYSIADVVGAELAPRFVAMKIKTPARLLERAASVRGRLSVAEHLGLATTSLLDIVNACDLLQVKGLGLKYIALLRAVNVRTVRDLRARNAENLFYSMAVENHRRKRVDFMPVETQVARWIECARQLPVVVTYR